MGAKIVNESLTVEPRKIYGGTSGKEGMVLVSQKGFTKILDLSKKNPSNVFVVRDDNYTNFGPFYVKNGKVAKYTVLNPNYDFQNNKVRSLKVPSDVILKFNIVESKSLREDKISDLEKLLKSHDWSYEYSDDHSKYKRGSDQRGEIFKLIKQLDSEGRGKEANALWKQYKKG